MVTMATAATSATPSTFAVTDINGSIPTLLQPASSHVPTATLVTLLQLQAEIVSMVALDLDLESLECFRLVNRRARVLVDATPEYRELCTRWASVHSFALAAGLCCASLVTLRDLMTRLPAWYCDDCGGLAKLALGDPRR